MNTALFFAFQTLDEVYRRDAYCSVVLPSVLAGLDEKDKRTVTRVVYGTLQHEYEFAWVIGNLCAKQPKAVVRVLLKMGMYLVKYMQSMPSYACVNEMVELAKGVKKEYVGFVNATLKAYCKRIEDMPVDPILADSVRFNLPVWAVLSYWDQFGREGAEARLAARQNHTHIRFDTHRLTPDEVYAFCAQKGISYTPTPYGILVGAVQPFAKWIADGMATVQALDSIYIANALAHDLPQGDILDACAAPGGKSVYLASICPQRRVISCDIHAHRVDLIAAYSARMQVTNVCPTVWDATQFNPEWSEAFAGVLVDAPCSGLGVAVANPDIAFRRTASGIDELARLQSSILDTAQRYVAKGGVLVYSTCTDLKQENQEVVAAFLTKHPQFVLEPIEAIPFANAGQYLFTPDDKGNDGFFVARLRRYV